MRTAVPLLKGAVIFASTLFFATLWMVFFYFFVINLQRLLYTWRSPTVEEQCRQIRPGMSRSETLRNVYSRTAPNSVFLGPKSLRFARDGSTLVCEVEFDASTQVVVKVSTYQGIGYDPTR